MLTAQCELVVCAGPQVMEFTNLTEFTEQNNTRLVPPPTNLTEFTEQNNTRLVPLPTNLTVCVFRY